MENIQQIIHKSRLLTERLQAAIKYQDRLASDGFDITDVEFSKALESSKENLSNLENKYVTTQKKIEKVQLQVNTFAENLKKVSEENSVLEQCENQLLNSCKPFNSDRYELAQELQNKLKTYKAITGVRFDLRCSDDILSGYVGLSGNKASECSLIPFELDKNNHEYSNELWEKINNTCTNVIKCE